MEGLTAKVFRTFRASLEFTRFLYNSKINKETDK